MIKDKELELSYEELFQIDNQKKLGVMRIDWYDGKLSNTWNPTELLINLKKNNKIDLQQLQEELNYIQFDKLNSFDKIVKMCDGTGYERETLLFVQGKYNNYAIKLIPVRDSYSYIFTYNK